MRGDSKTKIFKDPVHGYIEIPSNICEDFIDTPIFQRLKQIRQTNMIGLYPSANHNRFVHSLGVFHLAKIAFNFLQNNIGSENTIDSKPLSKLKDIFLITCLMHDCAHAPFSHCLEAQYDKKQGTVPSKLNDILVKTIGTERFKKDLPSCNPQAHEKVSVIVLLQNFKKQLSKYNVDPELAARMILGCKYQAAKNSGEKIKNCLIELLNSKSIDIDSIEYILRDTWASGVSNQDIDIIRLLSSLTILTDKNEEYELAFKKSSLSVIKSVIDGRNHLYKWVYSHHKLVYEQELLLRAIQEVAELLYGGNPEKFNSKVFSVELFSKPSKLVDGTGLFLLTDGDLIYLLKKYVNELPSAKRLLYRNHHKVLWKTYEEFDSIFDCIDSGDRKVIENNAKESLYKEFNSLFGKRLKQKDVLVIGVNPKIKEIEEN